MRHLDSQLLLLVLAGEVPPRTLLQLMYDHLKELCPECRSNLEMAARELDWTLDEEEDREGSPARENGDDTAAAPAANADSGALEANGFESDSVEAPGFDAPSTATAWSAAAAPAAAPRASTACETAPPPGLYDGAFARAERAAVEAGNRLLAERDQAEGDLAELLRLQPADRRAAVEIEPRRFGSRWLAQLLIEECPRAVRRSPREALSLADLVPLVLERIPEALAQPWGVELHARGMALRGNALRVQGDLAAADAVFFELHRYLASHALEIDDLHPDLPSLEASLRSDQHRYGEALDLLDRTVAHCTEIGDQGTLARALTKRGVMKHHLGDATGAAADQERALSLLDPVRDAHTFLCAVGNHCASLLEAGHPETAERLLDEHRELIRRQAEPWLDVRLAALRGRIDLAAGREERAEERLLAARNRYAEQELPFDAAFVSLDLAALYLRQGRHAELAETARWMGLVFDTAGVDSDALVAAGLFQRAVAAEHVSRETLESLRHKLQRIGARPARGVHQPS